MIILYMVLGAFLLWLTILCVGVALANYDETRAKNHVRVEKILKNEALYDDFWKN